MAHVLAVKRKGVSRDGISQIEKRRLECQKTQEFWAESLCSSGLRRSYVTFGGNTLAPLQIIFLKIILSITALIFCLLQIYQPIKPKFFKYITVVSGAAHTVFVLVAVSGILMMLMYGTGTNISFSRALSIIFEIVNLDALIKGAVLIIVFLMLLFVLPIVHQNIIAKDRTVNRF